MANLPENPAWASGVYQLETTDPVLGGADGVSNRPLKDLASRTLFLRNALAAAGLVDDGTGLRFVGQSQLPVEAAEWGSGVSDESLVYREEDGIFYASSAVSPSSTQVVGIAFPSKGYIITHGLVETAYSAFPEGSTVYLSKTTPGRLTSEINHAPVGTHLRSGVILFSIPGLIADSGTTVRPWKIISEDFQARPGDRILVDSAEAGATITLPADPFPGAEVWVADGAGAFGTNKAIIDGNGRPVMGLMESMVISTDNASVTLVYVNETSGWRIA